MPVPVPHQSRLPPHQVIKPSSKGNVDTPAGHNAPKYVIQGATRQPVHTTADFGSQNWTDSSLSRSGQTRHFARDTEERWVISTAATFDSQEPAGSAAGQPRYVGHRSSPVHSSVHNGERADSRIMTWLKNVDPLPIQGSVSSQEVDANLFHRPSFPVKPPGAAEIYAEAYDNGVYSRLPLKLPQTAFEDFEFMEADPLDNITSTFEGVTPFAAYIDRITSIDANNFPEPLVMENPAPLVETPRLQKPPSPERLTDPVYIKSYHSLAGSLSEWMAEYVWKVCTKGMSLPPRFVGMRSGRLFSERPPTMLAESIRSLLCATLLQPSGVALALWYISRLPVFVEQQVPAGTLTAKEVEFRTELFGDGGCNGAVGDSPFKVVLVGCMLANKWLDDHTFSNKTWHSVTSIPLQTINRLELLALGVLSHDLSVPPQAWEHWLVDLRSYHASLSPFPSPIRRPSTTDSNSFVKKLIDDLIMLQSNSSPQSTVIESAIVPQPMFSELLAKEEERPMVRDPVPAVSYDIDLDEDGPLRAEYVPKRRSSQRSSYSNSSDHGSSMSERFGDVSHMAQPTLPPPAIWVPHEDPPIERQQTTRDRYLAVAPIPPVSAHGRSISVEVQQQQPWWVEEQNKITSVPRQDTINAAGNGLYSAPSVSMYTYSTVTIAPPISYTRSTLSSGQNPTAMHLRAFSYSQMDCDASNYSHCGPPVFAPAYASADSGAPFSFRPQFLRA